MPVEVLYPAAVGNYTDIEHMVGFDPYHWDKVDDPAGAPDEATTFIWTMNVAQKKDAYKLTSPSMAANSVINSVTVYHRGANSSGGGVGSKIQPFLLLDMHETAGTEIPNANWWATNSEVISRPGGGTWSVDDLSRLQVVIGLKSNDGVDGSSCTQVYVEVDYDFGAGVETLWPTSPAGDETAISFCELPWMGHEDAVNEAIPSDDNLYHVLPYSLAYQRDLYVMDNHVHGSGVIRSIIVCFRCKSDSALYEGRAEPSQKSGATVTDGAEVVVSSAGWATYAERYFVNPATGVAYTWGEIDSLQVGVSLKSTSTDFGVKCSAVYLVVDYLNPIELGIAERLVVRVSQGGITTYSAAMTEVGVAIPWGNVCNNVDFSAWIESVRNHVGITPTIHTISVGALTTTLLSSATKQWIYFGSLYELWADWGFPQFLRGSLVLPDDQWDYRQPIGSRSEGRWAGPSLPSWVEGTMTHGSVVSYAIIPDYSDGVTMYTESQKLTMAQATVDKWTAYHNEQAHTGIVLARMAFPQEPALLADLAPSFTAFAGAPGALIGGCVTSVAYDATDRAALISAYSGTHPVMMLGEGHGFFGSMISAFAAPPGNFDVDFLNNFGPSFVGVGGCNAGDICTRKVGNAWYSSWYPAGSANYKSFGMMPATSGCVFLVAQSASAPPINFYQLYQYMSMGLTVGQSILQWYNDTGNIPYGVLYGDLTFSFGPRVGGFHSMGGNDSGGVKTAHSLVTGVALDTTTSLVKMLTRVESVALGDSKAITGADNYDVSVVTGFAIGSAPACNNAEALFIASTPGIQYTILASTATEYTIAASTST